jgi:two-component system nitrate/nitrite response regulator NarL
MRNSANKIRVLVIEDNPVLREGIISILKPYREITILSESDKRENTILQIHKLKPGIILIDLSLRSRNSLCLVEKLKREFAQSKIIVMDLVPVQADINLFVKAGASGFILKDTNPDEFIKVIKSVSEGAKVLPQHLNYSLLSRIIEYAIKSRKSKLVKYVSLTGREKELLSLISKGNTNKKIADKLNIPEYSIVNLVRNVFEKLVSRTNTVPLNIFSGIGNIITFSGCVSLINKNAV